MRRALAPAAVALTLAALAPSAHAVVMREIPLEELITESDAIVHGRVERVGTRTVIAGRAAASHLIATLRVLRAIKGELPPRIEIDELGAAEGSVSAAPIVPGAPRLRAGDELVLFLRRLPGARPRYRTLAMDQGRFEVLRGSGEPRLARDLSSMALLDPAPGARAIRPGRRDQMPLADLVALVEATLAAEPSR